MTEALKSYSSRVFSGYIYSSVHQTARVSVLCYNSIIREKKVNYRDRLKKMAGEL